MSPHKETTPPELAALVHALQVDPRVGSVQLRHGPAGRPTVLVTPDAAWFADRRVAEADALSRRRRRHWEMVYDGAFHAEGPPRAPDFTTWTSSLTRAPIPPGQMRVWLDATLGRLRGVPHGRVLDLGCGIGLVVADLAPGCREYLALDASGEAIAALGAWARTQPSLRHVRLAHRAAHELAEVPDASIDLVILNSVVQYFPDVDYLLRVLRAALRCLAPGGRIFLGDLRMQASLPAHAAAVALARAPTATAAGLREACAAILAGNRELTLDPALFARPQDLMPRLSAVRFGLKPAGTDPELAAYRFDAMLEFDGTPTHIPPTLAWGALAQAAGCGAPLDQLAHRLRQDAGNAVAVLGVPNARTAGAATLARLLADASPGRAGGTGEPDAGIEPEALAALAASLGHAAELRPTPGSQDGRFDALLHRPGTPVPAWPWDHAPVEPANDPLATELADGLRSALQRVADTLVPQGTVLVRTVVPGAAAWEAWG